MKKRMGGFFTDAFWGRRSRTVEKKYGSAQERQGRQALTCVRVKGEGFREFKTGKVGEDLRWLVLVRKRKKLGWGDH